MNNKLDYAVRDGVALITLNDPPANTYSYELMQQLDRAIPDARMDDAGQVIVSTGAREQPLCAAADLRTLAARPPRRKQSSCLHATGSRSRLEQTPKLMIAAINGHCVGGGLEVAMAADIRVARRTGGKMGLPEVTLGVLPGTGGTQRLVRLVGKPRAIEMMATGELFPFEVCREMGLIDRLLVADTSESFIEQVFEYARQFTTPAKAAMAVGRIKRAVQTGAEIPLDYGLALERELQQQLFQSEDAREGLQAYVEKRKAEFKGR